MKRRHDDTQADASDSTEEEQPGQWQDSALEACHVSPRRRLVDPSGLTPKQLDRVLKNRQAAQASRDRKRTYVTELEASNDRLKTEARDLRTRVHVLEREKVSLSGEVSQLKTEFDQLRALLLARLNSPTQPAADELVDEQQQQQHSPTHVAPGPEPQLPAATHRALASAAGLALRPADSPATRVHRAGSSPSIRLADHLLGARRDTNQQLPARSQPVTRRASMPLATRNGPRFSLPVLRLVQLNHLYRQGRLVSVAPLTHRLLRGKSSTNRVTGGRGRMQRHQSPLMKTGSSSSGPRPLRLSIQQARRMTLSSTWRPRRISLSDLMNMLISKYQPK